MGRLGQLAAVEADVHAEAEAPVDDRGAGSAIGCCAQLVDVGLLVVAGDRRVQEPRLLPWRKVEDNIALALANGPERARRHTHARSALEEVGLGPRSQISGVGGGT